VMEILVYRGDGILDHVADVEDYLSGKWVFYRRLSWQG